MMNNTQRKRRIHRTNEEIKDLESMVDNPGLTQATIDGLKAKIAELKAEVSRSWVHLQKSKGKK